MEILNRFEYETSETESKLNEAYRQRHMAVVRENMSRSVFSLSRHMRRMSATIWHKEQTKDHPHLREQVITENVQAELMEEARAIVSDYGALSLSGLRLLLVVTALWLVLQFFVDFRINFVLLFAIVLMCTVIYPIAVYHFWNRGSVHPFKVMKLVFGVFGAVALGTSTFLLSKEGALNLLLQGNILVPFNLTEFLILFNTAVTLSFIIYYRRMNQFTEVYNEYEERIVSLSRLGAVEQQQIETLLKSLEPIPLKTYTKRNLKCLLIKEFEISGMVSEAWVQDFIRRNCIAMNWIYWYGTVVQWTLLILLASKLVWSLDSGLMVSADYFRQELTTGMVFGALIISSAVICPMNYGFRELLYQRMLFSLKQAWLLICLMSLCISTILFFGLVPSRFIWGYPVNPAPNLWGLLLLIVLVVVIQFIKSDPRLVGVLTNKK